MIMIPLIQNLYTLPSYVHQSAYLHPMRRTPQALGKTVRWLALGTCLDSWPEILMPILKKQAREFNAIMAAPLHAGKSYEV
jgi:hypothetical protein